MAKILCIDDDLLIRMTTCDYLDDIGHEVLDASSGAGGVKKFRQHQPDLVLSDLRMPGGDGFLVLAHLVVESPETPVLIVSGTGTVDEAVKTMRMGAWDYLTKPVADMQLLGRAVERLLAKARERRTARQLQQTLVSRNQDLEREVGTWARKHQDTVLQLEKALQTSTGYQAPAASPAKKRSRSRVAGSIGEACGLEAILNESGFLTPDEVGQIRSHAPERPGTHFCPRCVAAFARVLSAHKH